MTKWIFSRWILVISAGLGLLLLALLLTSPGSPAEAAPSAPTYAVAWYTADNGSGVSSGGSYEVAGTIGQMDAAPGANNPQYGLDSGFWAAFLDRLYEVFLPAVIK